MRTQVRGMVLAGVVMLAPGMAHAQCNERGGLAGFIDSVLDIFRSKKIKFDGSSNGRAFTGEIEVKGVSCGSTTLNVRLTAAEQLQAEGKRGPVGGGIDIRAGVAVEYELTLPDKDWANTSAPPNPLDPASLPPGGSMLFRREYFASLGLEGQYKALVAAAGYEEGAGVVVAVQRNEDGTTKLMVGPYSVVKNEFMVGVGKGDFAAGIGRDDKLETGTLRSWTFDPSKPEDVRAYQSAFGQSAALGTVLFTDRPAETVEYATYESQSGIRLSGGPVSFSGNFGQSTGDLRYVTRPDGSVTVTAVADYNGTILSQTREYTARPPQGQQIGQDKLSVSFTNTDDSHLQYLAQAMGYPANTMPPGGFKIDITEDNWREWRDRAREYIADHPNSPMGFPLEDLANATGPRDVAHTLYLVGSNPVNNDTLPILMVALYDRNNGGDRNSTLRPLPGNAGKACPNAPDTPLSGAPSPQDRATQVASKWCGSNIPLLAPTAVVSGPNGNGNSSQTGASPAGILR